MKSSERKRKYLSYRDSLTDLYNRAFFHEKMEQLYTEALYGGSISNRNKTGRLKWSEISE